MPQPPRQLALQLRIQLEEISPVIWRRLLVPASVRLAKLHDIFQAAMGWTNSHLHNFQIGDELYGTHFDDYPDEEIDEKTATVLQAIGERRRFTYEYDFGDSWGHQVIVEARLTSPLGLRSAVCLDGQNACPPEDCGGPWGFAELLEVLADPTHEEYESTLTWVGGTFDPAAFDLVTTNAELQRLR